jgi:hypothetical protein
LHPIYEKNSAATGAIIAPLTLRDRKNPPAAVIVARQSMKIEKNQVE